jgi:gluconolactonase
VSTTLGEPTPVVDMEIFTQLPANLHVTEGVSRWAEIQKGNGRIPAFIEGPALTSDGDLFLVDVAWGRILKVDRTGRFAVVYQYNGAPNGLTLKPDGSLLIADHHLGLLHLHSPLGSPSLSVIADRFGHEHFRGLNDLTLDPFGSILATDQGGTGLQDPTGKVLRYDTDQICTALVTNVPSPNGIAVSRELGSIYVAVTRDNSIWRIPMNPGGAVTKVGRYIQLSGGDGPDGIVAGPNGTLLVAHLGPGLVWVFDRRGLPIVALRSPLGLGTTNVVIDIDGVAYVTESETNTVLRVDILRFLEAAAA